MIFQNNFLYLQLINYNVLNIKNRTLKTLSSMHNMPTFLRVGADNATQPRGVVHVDYHLDLATRQENAGQVNPHG